MPKFTKEQSQMREDWVRQLFLKNPKISGPEMVKMLKKHDKAGMRMGLIYEIRDEVLKQLKWTKDERGNPIPPPTNGAIEQAHREGDNGKVPKLPNPLVGRCVIPCEDVTDATSFQQKLQFMNEEGFLNPKLKVETATDSYIIVARSN